MSLVVKSSSAARTTIIEFVPEWRSPDGIRPRPPLKAFETEENYHAVQKLVIGQAATGIFRVSGGL
jgi:hypothetical protein